MKRVWVCNDTPVWLKPRRTRWFLVREDPARPGRQGEPIHDQRGGPLRYATREKAERGAAIRGLEVVNPNGIVRPAP